MVLVDTSAWIEWLIGSPTGEALSARLPEQSDWLVPTMVQLELAKWLTREVGEDKADQVIAFTQVCQVVRWTQRSRSRRLTPAARTSSRRPMRSSLPLRRPGATLLTCDAHFEGSRAWTTCRRRTSEIRRTIALAPRQRPAPTRIHLADMPCPYRGCCRAPLLLSDAISTRSWRSHAVDARAAACVAVPMADDAEDLAGLGTNCRSRGSPAAQP